MVKHPNSIELLGYWNRIRTGGAIPARSAFNPAAIPKALPSVFLLETTTGPATFRLAGTAVCAAHMRELRDSRFSSLWTLRDHRRTETAVRAVAGGDVGAVLVSTADTGAETVEFETLLLPMLDRNGRPTLVIGTMSHFNRPWSLGAKPLSEHELSSMQMLPVDDSEPESNAPTSSSSGLRRTSQAAGSGISP